MHNYHILITNDDGIASPGLRAAVEAVADLGRVTVVAPSAQQTGTGRGLIGEKAARLIPMDYRVDGRPIEAFHCACSPALIVRHSLRTIFKAAQPDLLISGINYGENLGINITCSGTVGAALEAASAGIAGIAISKQTEVESHHRYSDQDWSASAHFLRKFSTALLAKKMPPDVDVLKIDVPLGANPSTAWQMTRLARSEYYTRAIENPDQHTALGDGELVIRMDKAALGPDTDIHVLAIDQQVSVTPLSVDLTSRVNLSKLEQLL